MKSWRRDGRREKKVPSCQDERTDRMGAEISEEGRKLRIKVKWMGSGREGLR
jgi:hypothetical protein